LTKKEKKPEKKKKKKPIFEGSYLENTSECEVMTLAGISTAKESVGFVEVSQSYLYVKISLLLLLLITYGCGMLASWDTQHTTVFLDQYNSIPLPFGIHNYESSLKKTSPTRHISQQI